MSFRPRIVVWCALCAVFLAAGGAGAEVAPAWFRPPEMSLIPEGRFVYERNCQVCHGRWGDGDGDMAKGMLPRPRKFSAGVFKYRSTPSGALPSDADLKRTIRGGVYGSAMPVFAQLGDREVRSVIAYVKSFSSRWDKPQNFAAPLAIPEAPGWMSDTVEHDRRAVLGKAFFARACAACHGPEGKGDGPAAETLEDDRGQPARPRDLGLPSIGSGHGPRDIYKALVTGLNGTPMPSFSEATTEAERWDLVAFVETLRRAGRRAE